MFKKILFILAGLMLLWVPSAYAFEPITATTALAALAAAGGTAGTGWSLWNMFGGGEKKKKGTEGQYDIIQPPQYSFTEPRMRLTSDFISQNIGRMGEGKFPSWYEGIAPQLKEQQDKALRESYYGNAFSPGILESSKSFDVARGLPGGAGAGRNYNAQLAKYGEASRAIDQYIAELGYTAQREGATAFPSMSLQMPKGPDALGFNYVPPEGESPSGMDTLLQSLGQVAPWLLQNMGGGGGTTDYNTASASPYAQSGGPGGQTVGQLPLSAMSQIYQQQNAGMAGQYTPWSTSPYATGQQVPNAAQTIANIYKKSPIQWNPFGSGVGTLQQILDLMNWGNK